MTDSDARPAAILSPSEARLLLLASRPAWTEAQKSLAAMLVPEVRQWGAFTDTAWRKLSLPMVYGNLSGVQNAGMAEGVMPWLRELSFRATTDMLRRQAAFDWFHANCILPAQVDHAYFKGPALASRFYADPMKRYFRDVDILVPNTAKKPLLRSLQARGCRIMRFSAGQATFPELKSDSALSDYLFVTPVPHLLTPQGLMVELHTEIDLQTALFDTGRLLAGAQEIARPTHSIRVLPDLDHIVYFFYHHTRHLWSKLNWLADVDTVCTHGGVDRAAVLDHARRLGIAQTVAAVFDFHQLAADGKHPSMLSQKSPGRDLLQACLDNLPGDLALEQSLRRGQRLNAIKFDWQPVPVSGWRYASLRLRRFRPTHEDMQVYQHGRVVRYMVAGALRMSRALKSLFSIGRAG